jgi:hypothetical protein
MTEEALAGEEARRPRQVERATVTSGSAAARSSMRSKPIDLPA